ncbi:MAG: hypothetical protein DKM50_04015 [Candidatus Margulisiibacteriota bacterium]|nr:MAG: hypothetical protein A2X43_01730 [Candidatus Margulisbacteria bacterium GWD2_39_127]OGI05496.1 MAG: hypothetical protein A2X42_00105 [Candidatus Margulisbacteria bacterium GWF2_38_17]OGI08306.1 MAG: hypothetical protein A2X41_00140 [Candidatus Margulisbacteria bacterium GWE2_39_32]PZM82302.1 MAG: hypothetical protein DKM50_04015 [Candidatus Margulisiibacteriota bacterium]HAR62952.1 hypothetical protein [Candidatus Margulisiibacteriota bacterium]
METQQLILIKRQFKLMNQQVVENYPSETGGFFGGLDNVILGIFPLANKYTGLKAKDTFSITEDDIYFAQKFFKDAKLQIMGMYHSHPNGAPAPSDQDMTHLVGDKFGRHHLIVSIKPHNLLKQKFNVSKNEPAYQIRVGLYYCPSHKQKIPIELKIVEDSAVHHYINGNNSSDLASNTVIQDYFKLEERISQMIQTGRVDYEKEDSFRLSSSNFNIDT